MDDEVVRLIGISPAPLDVEAVYDVVRAAGAGGIAVFVGTVRDSDEGRDVTALSYSAHPSAEAAMRAVVEDEVGNGLVDPHDRLSAVAAVHRVGDLAVGDAAIVVAVATGHRQSAFALCERLVDAIKARVPIWKHQTFADGTDEWVGTPG